MDHLKNEYALPGLDFTEGEGGLPMVIVDTSLAKARISLYGGQLLSYIPADQKEDVFFLSKKAYYQTGKSIKGGVPICWPWFGDSKKPAHGFARNSLWEVASTKMDGDTCLVELTLPDTAEAQAMFPHACEVRLLFSIGSTLEIQLNIQNNGDDTIELTQAFHSYFRIGDISQVSVTGLNNLDYLDKTQDMSKRHQEGPITINGETDRIYLDTPALQNIEDKALGRRITLENSGTKTAVVWNPWSDISKNMADLEDGDYQNFICVETTNAAHDVIQLTPGQKHKLGTKISVESM